MVPWYMPHARGFCGSADPSRSLHASSQASGLLFFLLLLFGSVGPEQQNVEGGLSVGATRSYPAKVEVVSCNGGLVTRRGHHPRLPSTHVCMLQGNICSLFFSLMFFLAPLGAGSIFRTRSVVMVFVDKT